MKSIIGAALLAVMSLPAGAACAAPAPLMKVLLKPSAMSAATGKGDLEVTLTVPDVNIAAGAPLLSLQVMIPGADHPQDVEGMTVADGAGPAPLSTRMDGVLHWTSARAITGVMIVHYHTPIENPGPGGGGGPQIYPRIDGESFSSKGSMILAAPELTTPYRIAIDWDLSAMGPGATALSSFGDGDVELPAGAVDRLSASLIMAGHLKREPQLTPSAFAADWAGGSDFDPRPAMQWTGKLHSWMSIFFQDKAEPLYRVFLRYSPSNAGGGVATINSFMLTYGKGTTTDGIKVILGHEMTHTWTANDLGKWYDEGDAVYYQARLPWLAGLISTDAYLADVNDTAARYYTNAEIGIPDETIAVNYWGDMWRNVLPYDRGAMYFAVLDGKIRRASGGKRSVDDAIRGMVERKRAGLPITESAWMDLLHKELGDEGPAIHHAMMAGKLMLPESGDFGPCFRRVARKIRRFDLGFKPRSLPAGDRLVQDLEPGSEAAKAGLQNGDQVHYAYTTDDAFRSPDQTLDVKVTRDGKTFQLTYLPRGAAVDAYQWEKISGMADSACRR